MLQLYICKEPTSVPFNNGNPNQHESVHIEVLKAQN